MIPVWKLRFWTEHVGELVPVAKIAAPIALVWSFVDRALAGTIAALAFNPTLLGLSMVAIVLDTTTGCYKALRKDTEEIFDTATFGRVIDKTLKYTVIVVAFSAIAAAGERGELPNFAFAWLRDFGYLVVVVRESGSAVENLWGKPLGEVIGQFRDTVQDVTR